MVIGTVSIQAKPKLPSKKPFGAIYDIAKEGLKQTKYWREYGLERYDPDYYLDKYTYKPRKRLAGYAGQKIHGLPKKKFFKTRQFYEKSGKRPSWFNFRSNFIHPGKCSGFGYPCSG